MMRGMCLGLVVFAALAVTIVNSQNWSGNYQSRYGVVRYEKVKYCRMRSMFPTKSWCFSYAYYNRAVYGYIYSCAPGWTHNGDQNCNTRLEELSSASSTLSSA